VQPGAGSARRDDNRHSARTGRDILATFSGSHRKTFAASDRWRGQGNFASPDFHSNFLRNPTSFPKGLSPIEPRALLLHVVRERRAKIFGGGSGRSRSIGGKVHPQFATAISFSHP